MKKRGILGGGIIAGIAIGVATVVYSLLQKHRAPTKAEARARRLRNPRVGQRIGSVMVPISVVIALFSPRGGKVVIMVFLGGFLTPSGIGALTVINWPKDIVACVYRRLSEERRRPGSVHPASLRFRLC